MHSKEEHRGRSDGQSVSSLQPGMHSKEEHRGRSDGHSESSLHSEIKMTINFFLIY